MWADRLRPAELHDEAEVPVIRPSRGTHLVVESDRAADDARARSSPPASGRTIFVLPWLGQTLIGTTDTDHDGDADHVQPSEADVALPARRRQRVLRAPRSTPADLAGAYAGVRPLISTGDRGKSVDISRKAELYETSSGMITITGGKLTTWRRMAKQTVDRIVERDGSRHPLRHARDPARDGGRARRPRRPRPEGAREQLAGRYGHVAHDVLAPPGDRLRADRRRAGPTCWPRSPTPPGASRRARSATCCCAAPGSG